LRLRIALITFTILVVTSTLLDEPTAPQTFGETTEIVPSTIVSLYQSNLTEIKTYRWQGVDWIVYYGGNQQEVVNTIHSEGMKVLLYVTAYQQGPGWSHPKFSQNWTQFDGTNYIMPPYTDQWGGFYRLSPYSPYTDLVLLPSVEAAVRTGADGIFLDSLLLHPDADKGPYAMNAWSNQYSGLSFQDFRERSLHDSLKRIYNLIKGINPSAILTVNNNNIFAASDRLRYASSIEKWQDASDGFLLEIVGVDPYGDDFQIAANLLLQERNAFGVTKPLWLLYYSLKDKSFEYLAAKSIELNYGFWAYNKYILKPNLIIYNKIPAYYSIRSNATIKDFEFDRARRLINFTTSRSSTLTKACWVETVVPKAMPDGPPLVFVDEGPVAFDLHSNQTHYTMKFNASFSQSNSCSVSIGGANTIPEYSNHLVLLAATMVILTTSLKILKKRRSSSPYPVCEPATSRDELEATRRAVGHHSSL